MCDHSEDAVAHPKEIRPDLQISPPQIIMRNYFSTHLLWAARDSALKAGAIEDNHTGRSRFDIEHRFTKMLRGHFPDNQLMAGSGNAWWPDHALGAGCADWAFKSAKHLADVVADSLQIRPNYQRNEASWYTT